MNPLGVERLDKTVLLTKVNDDSDGVVRQNLCENLRTKSSVGVASADAAREALRTENKGVIWADSCAGNRCR